MGLNWSDIDFATNHITWRAKHDKKRKTWVTPYPAQLFAEIRAVQRQLDVVGGFVFPGQRNSARAAPAELLSQWIAKAEEVAGLPKLNGGTCHPYRRRWRTDRNHLPIKAVAVAGGWSDIGTMLRCYDHPDDAAVLAVTSETKRRLDRPAM